VVQLLQEEGLISIVIGIGSICQLVDYEFYHVVTVLRIFSVGKQSYLYWDCRLQSSRLPVTHWDSKRAAIDQLSR
ncbi:MAG: hypothetical protein WBN49_07040, partial [Arenicellales bacterium]